MRKKVDDEGDTSKDEEHSQYSVDNLYGVMTGGTVERAMRK